MQDKKPLVEFIVKRMAELGIKTQKNLSTLTGVSPATINRIFQGRDASGENVIKILNALSGDTVEKDHLTVSGTSSRPIPLISWIHAGNFAEAVDSWPEGMSGEGDPVFTHRPVGCRAFALRVVGDSMETRFKEGDIIVVDPDLGVSTGDPCVARVAGEVTFKIYYENGTEIRLKAKNPKYPDMVFPKDGAVDFCVVGKVVEMIPKI